MTSIPVFHSQEEWKKAGKPNAWLFRKGWPDARTLDCYQLMYRASSYEADAKWHERTCPVATASVVEEQPRENGPWSFEQGKLLFERKPVHVYFATDGRWHGWFYDGQGRSERDRIYF